jgi:hypothetical protein
MGKEMAMNICIWKRFCLGCKAGYQNSPWRTRNTYRLKRLNNRLSLLFLFN